MNDDILTAEILDFEEPLSATIDFAGEFISGSDGEDYKRGYADGETQGLTVGRAEGYNNGYSEGHSTGYAEGQEDGRTEGYNNGYAEGKEDGYAEAKVEWYNDGNTHIWIHLADGRTSPMLGCCPNGTVTVDWGDGTPNDILTGTSTSTVKWTPTHNYATAGDYVITLIVNGTVGFNGYYDKYAYSCTLSFSKNADYRNIVYIESVKKLELGNNISLKNFFSFVGCNFSNIVIPNGVNTIGYYTFQNCKALSNVVIPDSVTQINSYAFDGCVALSSVVLPRKLKIISDYFFNNCKALSSVVIPDSVTSIGYMCFTNCYGMRYCDFTAHTSVPTLTNKNTFNGIPDDCEIRVPSALYDEWINATNWSTYADHIVAV